MTYRTAELEVRVRVAARRGEPFPLEAFDPPPAEHDDHDEAAMTEHDLTTTAGRIAALEGVLHVLDAATDELAATPWWRIIRRRRAEQRALDVSAWATGERLRIRRARHAAELCEVE